MYPSSGTVIRADLNIKVEEAAQADRFHIGHLVMPHMPVPVKTGTYPKIKIAKGQLMKAGSTLRAPDGSYSEVTREFEDDNYTTVDRGLEERVDDSHAKDVARFFNLEQTKSRLVLRNMKLDHEVRVKDAILNTTNFGAATNSTVAYTVANLATIDFPADVIAGVNRVADKGVAANTIVISGQVFDRLVLSTKLQAWVRGTLKGHTEMPVNAPNLTASFADYGITQVLIGRARVDTAKQGQAASVSQVWGTAYVWVGYVNPGAKLPDDGGAGFTFTWNEEGGLFVTETYRDDKRRSNMVRVRQHTSEKVSDGTAGTLIATQWA